jgi:hypothetical protein
MADTPDHAANRKASATDLPNISREKSIGTAVPMALGILLLTIDQCHDLFSYLPSPESLGSNFTTQYKRVLSTRDQKELDQAVESYFKDMEVRTEREAAKLGLKESDLDPASIYPVAAEVMMAASFIVFEKVLEETAYDHFAKYANDPIKREYLLTKSQLGSGGYIESVLGAALLPLLVSKTEEFLAALLRTGLTLHPNSLGALPSIPNDIYEKYHVNISTADVRRWQIDQKVEGVIDGAPRDWQETILRWTRIDIAQLGGDWDVIKEMIQRRHAIVHNSGRVDLEYLRKVPDRFKFGLHIGSALVSNRAYIYPILIELETWATSLANRWSKNFFKEEGSYYPLTSTRITNLQKQKRWTQALTILDSLLQEPLPSDIDLVAVAQVNRWFCMQEIGRDSDSLGREIQMVELNESELSADAREIVKLGRYSLLRNYTALIKGIRAATEGQQALLEKQSLRNMPLMMRAMEESPQVSPDLSRGVMAAAE